MTEWLTDTEKRILLSAISREKKVCIQVDKESCREHYETSLESVCKSLEHKFMYDRLFKQIRAEVIEEFVSEIRKHHYRLSDKINSTDYGMFTCGIETIAEQLKEQNK